jgi:hypothetical protein
MTTDSDNEEKGTNNLEQRDSLGSLPELGEKPWFTLYVKPKSRVLHKLLSSRAGDAAARGGAYDGRHSSSSQRQAAANGSVVDLEIQRLAAALAGLRGECDVDVVDYCNSQARFTTGERQEGERIPSVMMLC